MDVFGGLGVLSYYKLEGPDRVSVSWELQNRPDMKLIGEDAKRILRKERAAGGGDASQAGPGRVCGEVHLQVSTMRASQGDDKKFYIYSGTKTLHLRAESREERAMWLENLQHFKECLSAMVPLHLMDPAEVEVEELLVSTDKVKQRLRDAGVADAVIEDCEEILRRDAEKLELETAVVNESQQAHSGRAMAPSGAGGDEPFLEEEDEEEGPTGGDLVDMELVGFNYPRMARRVKLPEPREVEKPVSLWSIIKDCVGKDLSRVCLPVYFNEPISTLQKCFEEMEYSWLLDRAYEYGRRGDQLMRVLHVAAFAVCHHPTIVACHCEGAGWKFWGDSNLKSKFWGPSIQLDPVGVLTLQFDDGEVTTGIYNIILGKLYVDHYGTMKINSNRGMSIRLKGARAQVRGFVQNEQGEKLATLMGKWDQHMYYIPGDVSKHQQKEDAETLEEAVLLWKRSPPSKYPLRYNLTSFAIQLNEITPGLQEHLPPTDSRLRPDQRALEVGLYDYSNEEKLRLEQRQRRARKEQEGGWAPTWFKQGGPHGTFLYQGGYWESRERSDWSMCTNIFAPDIPEPEKPA
eukprot:jgi/Mesen1/10882/ME000935S10226